MERPLAPGFHTRTPPDLPVSGTGINTASKLNADDRGHSIIKGIQSL